MICYVHRIDIIDYITEQVLDAGLAGVAVGCGGGGGGVEDLPPNRRRKKPGCSVGFVSAAASGVGLASDLFAFERKLPRTPSTGLEPIV